MSLPWLLLALLRTDGDSSGNAGGGDGRGSGGGGGGGGGDDGEKCVLVSKIVNVFYMKSA